MELADRRDHRIGDGAAPERSEGSNSATNALNQILQLCTIDVGMLADRLLQAFGSVPAILAADQTALYAVTHCARVSELLSAVGLLQRAVLHDVVAARPILSTSHVLHDYLRARMGNLRTEQVLVLYLNTRNELLGQEIIAKGTIDSVALDAREIIFRGLQRGATGFVLVHNHPSGDPYPSRCDVEVTARMCKAGELFSLKCLDHLIVGRDSVTSFRTLGLL